MEAKCNKCGSSEFKVLIFRRAMHYGDKRTITVRCQKCMLDYLTHTTRGVR